MTTSNKEALRQKLFEEVKAQGEFIEEIISHLSKMKEDELMKSARDKEEGEEWDEEEKADYEKNQLIQEDIDQMMAEGKVHLLLLEFKPQLRSTPGPWTFKRVHVNGFTKSGNARFQEDHDQLEWTSTVGVT